ncbi:MAG TPA: ATP-binding protein [Jatrophihabitans sp.]|jgi:anti-sigma regulatory factor (Ser/Thr protein kinase)
MTTARYPDSPASVAEARAFVAGALDGTRGDVRNRSVLITSELATNAVRHAHSPFSVDVTLTDEAVRVAVTDSGGAMPIPRDPRDTDTDGRGLVILRTLADNWGIDTAPQSTTVWFTVALAEDQMPSTMKSSESPARSIT